MYDSLNLSYKYQLFNVTMQKKKKVFFICLKRNSQIEVPISIQPPPLPHTHTQKVEEVKIDLVF